MTTSDTTEPDHTEPSVEREPSTETPAPELYVPTMNLLDNRLFRRTLLVGLLVVAIVGFVYACDNSVAGNNNVSESKPFPFVERLIPSSGAEVLQQSEVGIDLATGYDAYLIINGVQITNVSTKPEVDGLNKTLSVGLVTYTPGPGRKVARLEPELNSVTAMVWKQSDGPATAKPVYWTFNAA